VRPQSNRLRRPTTWGHPTIRPNFCQSPAPGPQRAAFHASSVLELPHFHRDRGAFFAAKPQKTGLYTTPLSLRPRRYAPWLLRTVTIPCAGYRHLKQTPVCVKTPPLPSGIPPFHLSLVQSSLMLTSTCSALIPT
jgi:hypothetical protein